MIKICLFEKDPTISAQLKKAVVDPFSVQTVISNNQELDQLINQNRIEILIINVSELSEEYAEKLREHIHYIITYSPDNTPALFKKALGFGAKDHLGYPFEAKEIGAALHKAQYYLANTQSLKKLTVKKSAKVITFISSKGGVGKSVIAANLGVFLQQQYKVLLIDAVPRFGSLDIMFDFRDKKSMALLPIEGENADVYWHEVNENLIKHPSGLQFLLAGDKKEDLPHQTKLRSVIAAAKDKFDYILIDTPSHFEEPVFSLLEYSDQIFYVSTFDIASLKNLRLGLESIKAYYFSTDKFKILINRFMKNSELTVPELEKFLKSKINAVLPEETEAIIHSINKGIPFIQDNQSGDFFEGINHLAQCIVGKECVLPASAQAEPQADGNWLKQLASIFGEN